MGWFAVIIGGVDIVFSLFLELDTSPLYLESVIIIFFIVMAIVGSAIYLVMIYMRKSAFKKDNKVRDLLVIGPVAGLGIFSVVFIPKLIPSFGYPIEVGGIVMLAAGLIILGISKWVNKTYRITA